jgi:hypothetical protein
LGAAGKALHVSLPGFHSRGEWNQQNMVDSTGQGASGRLSWPEQLVWRPAGTYPGRNGKPGHREAAALPEAYFGRTDQRRRAADPVIKRREAWLDQYVPTLTDALSAP